jgi:hypothetical protein
MKRAALVAIGVFGCGVSVSSKEIADDTYSIKAKGHGGDNSGDVLEAMHQRAEQLCPDGYDVVGSTGGSDVNSYTNPQTGRTQVFSSPDGGLIVHCTNGDEAPSPSTPPPAPVAAARDPMEPKFWCSDSESGAVGLCEGTAAECESTRTRMGHMNRCIKVEHAACFVRESITTAGAQELVCAPTPEHCELLIQYTNANETGWRVAGACEIK